MRGLEMKVNGNGIEYQGHKVHIDIFIIGIDLEKFPNSLLNKDIKKRVEELGKEYSSKVTIFNLTI